MFSAAERGKSLPAGGGEARASIYAKAVQYRIGENASLTRGLYGVVAVCERSYDWTIIKPASAKGNLLAYDRIS
jgi:hypothetical protein